MRIGRGSRASGAAQRATSLSSVARERALLGVLLAIQLTLLLDFMLLMPLGPRLMGAFDLSAAQFGGLVSSYTIASALAGFSGALWLDRVDKKRSLLLLHAGFVVATFACGLAPGALFLLVARVVAGTASGLLWAVIMAVIIDAVPEERRGRAIGLVMTSYALSALLGVPLGLFIAEELGFRAPFLLLALSSVALWGAAWLVIPSGAPRPEGAKQGWRGALSALLRPQLILGWGLTFCVVFSGFLLIPYLSAFMVGNLGVSPGRLGWVYLAGGVVTFGSSQLIGRLVDRFGPAGVLAWLLALSMVPHVLFTHLAAAGFAEIVAAFVLFMVLTSGRQIPVIALVTGRVPPGLRGRYLAVNTATSDTSAGIASWVAGSCLELSGGGALRGFGALGWAAAGVSLCSLALLVFHRRADRVGASDLLAGAESFPAEAGG